MAMKMIAKIKSPDTPDKNGRVYPKEVLEKAVLDFEIQGIGELEHPNPDLTPNKINKIELTEDGLWAQIETLNV